MKLIRLVNPTVAIQVLGEYLLPDTDYDPQILRDSIAQMMTQAPDSVLVLCAVDGDKLQGFMLVTAEPHVRHAYIAQAWTDPKAPTYTTKKLFQRVVVWAEEMGKSFIRMETQRDPKGFTRRYAFQPYSTIMQYTIPEDSTLVEDTTLVDSPLEPQKDRVYVEEKQNKLHELHAGDNESPDGSGELPRTEDRERSEPLRFDAEGGSDDSGNAERPAEPARREYVHPFTPARSGGASGTQRPVIL